MIIDIATILWKELKEMFVQRSNLRGGWLGALIFLIVFGVFLPLQSGSSWLESPTSVFIWAWVPFILVNSIVADSFAGEKERHTLETLLASRLSDRTIILGKLAAALAYGWGITLIGILLALVTINVVYREGRLLFFPSNIGIAVFVLSFLVALLAAGSGVLVSLRATSVRQAQQTLSLAFIFLFIPLFILPILPEEWRQVITTFFSQLNLNSILVIFGFFLLILDLAILSVALQRFNRRRLILNQYG
jgi:ABC-2 type transport system permease protein